MTVGTSTSAPVATAATEDPRAAVDAELREFLSRERDRLLAVDAALAPVATAATEYLAGGKRLRPAFCYWGWRATGLPAPAGLIRAAASLELLQACALIHDDVMDGSDTRRGKPSAHRRFEAQHRAAGQRGDAAAFGCGAAILLGDLFLSWSDQRYSSSGLPDESLGAGRRIYDAMRTELMAGQYLDLLVQSQHAPERATVGKVLQYKSAKYTIEHPLQLGATLAGADERLIAGLGDFGLPLGEAFQLRDDLLGVFGDPELTGKPAGDDLREGKQTLLIAAAFAAADESERTILRAGLGKADLADDEVRELRRILLDTGAVAAIEDEIAARQSAALQSLEQLALPEPAAGALSSLAEAAVKRVR